MRLYFLGFQEAKLKIISSTNGTHLAKVALIFLFTFCVFLPILCGNMVHSVYFRNSYYKKNGLEFAKQKNCERFKKAKSYFYANDRNLTKSLYKDKLSCDIVDILIVVVTIKRKSASISDDMSSGENGYLTQTMAALDSEIRNSGQGCKAALMICNANHPAADHLEATHLSDYFISATISPYQGNNVPDTGRPKEQWDKIRCFNSSLKSNFRYLLMVEDDALPIKNFLPIMQDILKNNVETQISLGERKDNGLKWAYLNLHFPEVWQGYSVDIKSFCELISIGLLGGTLIVLVSFFLLSNSKRMTFDFITGALFCMLLTFVTGRQYFFEFWTFLPCFYQVAPAPGCCTPATLYPRHQIPGIVEYLQNVKCHGTYGIDIALSDYSNKFKLKKYLIFPNMFHHIGMYSGLSISYKNSAYYM